MAPFGGLFCVPFLIILSVCFIGIIGDEINDSTTPTEASSIDPKNYRTYDPSTTSGSPMTSRSTETSNVQDASTSVPSTAAPSASTDSSVKTFASDLRPAEPKLPVDLLSEDILLDPNVVLARVARQLGYGYGNSRYGGYGNGRRGSNRRRNQWSDYPMNFGGEFGYRGNNGEFRGRPVYPVFPGRK